MWQSQAAHTVQSPRHWTPAPRDGIQQFAHDVKRSKQSEVTGCQNHACEREMPPEYLVALLHPRQSKTTLQRQLNQPDDRSMLVRLVAPTALAASTMKVPKDLDRVQ